MMGHKTMISTGSLVMQKIFLTVTIDQ